MITRIYEKEYVTIDYDPSVPCLITTNIKFILLEELKSHLDFALHFMKGNIKNTGRMLWIADARLSPAVDTGGIEWVTEDWTPRALDAGIEYLAIVLPENEWAKMAVEEYTEVGENKGMIISYPRDVESAKNWFREMSGINK